MSVSSLLSWASTDLAKGVVPYLGTCFILQLILFFKKDWTSPRHSYWLTRIVAIRFLGFVYFTAFVVALSQNKQLIGTRGLLPAKLSLEAQVRNYGPRLWDSFLSKPTLYLFLPSWDNINIWLDITALLGVLLSGILIVVGGANMLLMFSLWILYTSIVNVGQRWYSFGWESQLLESGFLAIFMTPLWGLSGMPAHLPTPLVTVVGFRWILFRLMLGAGLIKARGDSCWKDLTCMDFHYQTQPVPNPLSYFMHQSSPNFHKFETGVNHVVELVLPWMIFVPIRQVRLWGGIFQILFQATLIISGNLSFLNWLTILPGILCLDDQFLSSIFTNTTADRASIFQKSQPVSSRFFLLWATLTSCKLDTICRMSVLRTSMRIATHVGLAILIVVLSRPVVSNLMATRQAMNTSFEPFRIVNTYGAFGSITRTRHEVIFFGTRDEYPTEEAQWLEYEFIVKPGSLNRRPPVISPFHFRLDWLMWFAGFSSPEGQPWIIHLTSRFLLNDKEICTLIASNPFEGGDPPRWVRADLYKYEYTTLGSEDAKAGRWWKRRYTRPYIPPVSIDTPWLNRAMKITRWADFAPGWPNSEEDGWGRGHPQYEPED